MNQEEKNREVLEGLLNNKVNRDIYLEMQNIRETEATEALNFFTECLFKPLDVMVAYDWKWFDKFIYLKNYLAQFKPEVQRYIVSKMNLIIEDRIDVEKYKLGKLLDSIDNITFEDNIIWKPKVNTPDILNSNFKEFIRGHALVMGILLTEEEKVEQFIKANRELISKKITPHKHIETNEELLNVISNYITSRLKHDIELDGGYRYLWKGDHPITEPNSQPFLKILLNNRKR